MGPDVKNFTGMTDPFLQEVLAEQYDSQLNRDIDRLMPGNTMNSLDPHLYDKLNGRLGSPMDSIAFMMLSDQPVGLASDAKLSINYGRKNMPTDGQRAGPRNYIPPQGGGKQFQIDQDTIPSYHNTPLDVIVPSNSSRMIDADFWHRSMNIPSRPKLIRSDARGGKYGARFKYHAGKGYHRFGKHHVGGFLLKNHGFQPMGHHWVHNDDMSKIQNTLGEASLNMVRSGMKSRKNKKFFKHLVSSGGGLSNTVSTAMKSKAADSIKGAIKYQAMKNLPTMSKALQNGRAGITDSTIMDNLGNLKKIYGEGNAVRKAIVPKLKRVIDFFRRKKKKNVVPITQSKIISSTPIPVDRMTRKSIPKKRQGKGGKLKGKKLSFLDYYS